MTKIQLRRDTAANRSTNNPTPSAGEPCFETGLYASVPAKAGDNVVAAWSGKASASILRFIYAVGSEPQSQHTMTAT